MKWEIHEITILEIAPKSNERKRRRRCESHKPVIRTRVFFHELWFRESIVFYGFFSSSLLLFPLFFLGSFSSPLWTLYSELLGFVRSSMLLACCVIITLCGCGFLSSLSSASLYFSRILILFYRSRVHPCMKVSYLMSVIYFRVHGQLRKLLN